MATPVIMPRQGQSVESCILVEWLAQVGDTVAKGDPLASIETDKAVFEVESPEDGTLLAHFFEAGADIPVLTHIAAIGEADEDVSALRPEGTAADAGTPAATPVEAAPPAPATEPATPAASTAAAASAPGVSPRARNRAAGSGIAAAELAGSGPGGRVIERDVIAAEAARPRMSGAARDAAAAGTPVPAAGSGPGGIMLSRDLAAAPAAGVPASAAPAAEAVTTPLSGIRKIIATKMHESLATTAQLTMNRSFDATAILAYRARLKAQGEALGLPNITINDIIAYATVRVLQQMPDLNAHFTTKGITRFPTVNLGVAMDTPRGLMVPVVHGAEQLSLAGLSRTLKPIIEDCQSGSVNPDLLTGGTFTITNLGMLGIENFTPILNIPEVAILGVGGLMLKPVKTDKGIEHVQAINLSLTVNHQAVDGAPGARFLQALCNTLEQFDLCLAA